MVPSCKEKRKHELLLGPWLSTYTGKLWSINYQDTSGHLSRPADCYRKEPRTRRCQDEYLQFHSTYFPFYCISTKHNSTQNNKESRNNEMYALVWSGSCVCERMGLSPPRVVLPTSSFLSRKEPKIFAMHKMRSISSSYKKNWVFLH